MTMNNTESILQIHAMQHQERNAHRCDYMANTGSVVFPSDRQALCNWGYQTIAACDGVSTATAVAAMSFFDQFLSSSTPAANRALKDLHTFQLAFVTCLVIALKVRSGFNVESDFMSEVVCGSMYKAEEIINMEIQILLALDWKVTGPTCHDFIDYFLEAIPTIEGTHQEFLNRFSKALAELAITRYSVALQDPSTIAFTAICCTFQFSEFASLIEGLPFLQMISGLKYDDPNLKSMFKTMIYLVREFLSESESPSNHPADGEISSVSSEGSPRSTLQNI